MSEGEDRLDKDILMILERDAVGGYEKKSWPSLSVIAYKLAEELGIDDAPDMDVKYWVRKVHARLRHLCQAGRLRETFRQLGPGNYLYSYQLKNPLDALAEAGE